MPVAGYHTCPYFCRLLRYFLKQNKQAPNHHIISNESTAYA